MFGDTPQARNKVSDLSLVISVKDQRICDTGPIYRSIVFMVKIISQ